LVFAEFLRWRADLLPSDILLLLADVAAESWRLSRDEAAALVRAEFGEAGSVLAATLGAEACWAGSLRCAFRARHTDREIVLQFTRPPIAPDEFATMERGLAAFREDESFGHVFTKPVFQQFRDWVAVGASAKRECRMLEAVGHFEAGSVTEFPKPIPAFCSDRVLALEWIEGEPLTGLVGSGRKQALEKWIESLLEQMCLFSAIDSDFGTDRAVLTPAGKIGLRYSSRFITVPPVHLRGVLKYLSAAFSGNMPAAAHVLLKMGGREGSDDRSMLDALAAVQPDLKVNMYFAASGSLLENQWRALAQLNPIRPLFVDCLHRNLIGAGFVAALRPDVEDSGDLLEQAHWPVLGRLIRIRMSELLTREAASDWLMGAGLLMVEGFRQVNRIAEDFRDEDVSVRVNVAGSGASAGDSTADRSAALFIVGGFLLAFLLLCLRWAAASSGASAIALPIAGAFAAIGLYLVVSHIE